MQLIVHKQLNIQPEQFSNIFSVPVWEIELQGIQLESEEFEHYLKDQTRYSSEDFNSRISRLRYVGQQHDPVRKFLDDHDFKDQMLEIAESTREFKSRFRHSVDWYKSRTRQYSSVMLDLPGFAMAPHIDNHDLMIQCIVNLSQDNTTATEFYTTDSRDPVYQAPRKRNHGVMFLNTAGAVHGIRNVDQPRWIWYGGIMIDWSKQ